jgi:hypothetical protein
MCDKVAAPLGRRRAYGVPAPDDMHRMMREHRLTSWWYSPSGMPQPSWLWRRTKASGESHGLTLSDADRMISAYGKPASNFRGQANRFNVPVLKLRRHSKPDASVNWSWVRSGFDGVVIRRTTTTCVARHLGPDGACWRTRQAIISIFWNG